MGDAALRQSGGQAGDEGVELGIGPARVAAMDGQLVRQADGGAAQQVAQGLAAGETVVVQGQSRIAPGLKVTPVNTDSTAELAQVAP